MRLANEIRVLLDDVREHGVLSLLDNATQEIQIEVSHAWISCVVRVTHLLCRSKDRTIATRLHELAGHYQTRPQEGWSAPPDWQCWRDEAESTELAASVAAEQPKVEAHAFEALFVDIEETLASDTLLADDDRFQGILVRAMTLLGLHDGDVAGRLPVSRSAVNRWRHGTSIPLPTARKPVYKFLLRRVAVAKG